jgi:ATP-binding cassette subfamily C protein
MGIFIDQFVYAKGQINVYSDAKILFFLAIIELIATFYGRLIKTHLKNRATFSLVFRVYNHVQKLPISYLDSIDKNYLTQRINQDVNQLYSFIFDYGITLILNILSSLVIILTIFHINHLICFYFLILIPAYVILYIIFKKSLFKKAYMAKELQNIFLATLNYQLNKVKSIKLNSWFELFDKKLQMYFF